MCVDLEEQEIKSIQLNTLRIVRDKKDREGTLRILFMGKSYCRNFLHDEANDVLHSFWFVEGSYNEALLSKASEPDELNQRIIENSQDSVKKTHRALKQ